MPPCSRRAFSALPDPALAELAAQLVAVDSVNPGLIAGASGERELAFFVRDWCEQRGLEVELVPPSDRPSVIAVARGSGGGRSLLLNAHLDTVGVAGMDAPHEPRIEDGRLYGRGAYDMKGALAAILDAAAHASGLHGVAAHGSRPHLGVDAIAKMGPVLVALKALDDRLQSGPSHSLVGPGSLHASLIEGGHEFSSYPARCLLTGERRTIPGETVERVEAELRAVAGEAKLRLTFSRDPFEAPEADPFVQLVTRIAGETEPVGVSYWADSGLIAGAGIPTVLFGPTGEGAHADVEWVDLASLERVRDVALATAVEWCG
jgi:acetylornithine deacetylase/succinyl-diaminopimelate desuccinylase-like protein